MPLLRRILLLVLSLSSCGVVAGQTVRRAPGEPLTPGLILVSSYTRGALYVYRAHDGAFRGRVEGLAGAQSIAYGPDGLLYVCAEEADRVLRVDPDSLTVLDVFVGDDPGTLEDESGGLDNPTAALFGPDGHLYVASFETDAILRFHGRTGAFLGTFVASGSGGLDGPDAGTKFGPDGDLYVPSYWNDRILRYDGVSGAFLEAFVPAGGSPLDGPRDLLFRGDTVLVASSLSNQVLAYDRDGNYQGVFAATNSPYCLKIQPDDGRLYVVSLQRNNVRVYDPSSGAFVRRIVDNGSGGLQGATFLNFVR